MKNKSLLKILTLFLLIASISVGQIFAQGSIPTTANLPGFFKTPDKDVEHDLMEGEFVDQITITENMTIGDLAIYLSIEDFKPELLTIMIKKDDGEPVVLHDGIDGSCSKMSANLEFWAYGGPFPCLGENKRGGDGTYIVRPSELQDFEALRGQSAAGVWTITVETMQGDKKREIPTPMMVTKWAVGVWTGASVQTITAIDAVPYGIYVEEKANSVKIDVNFDNPVGLNGKLKLKLNTGRTVEITAEDAYPNFNIGEPEKKRTPEPVQGVTKYTAEYKVAEGEYSEDLDVVSIEVEGALKSFFNSDVNLTIPEAGKLKNLKNVIVDGIKPFPASVTYNVGNNKAIIKMSEKVRNASNNGTNLRKRNSKTVQSTNDDLTIEVSISDGSAQLGDGMQLTKLPSGDAYELELVFTGTPDASQKITILVNGNTVTDYADNYITEKTLTISNLTPPPVPLTTTGVVFAFMLIGLAAFVKIRFF